MRNRTRTILVLSAFLSGCDGFEAIQQPDPNQILSIKNQSVAPSSTDRAPGSSPPIPIPRRPPSKQMQVPVTPPPVETPIGPLNLGGSISTAAIGDVVDADVNVSPFDTVAKMTFFVGNKSYSCTAEIVGDSGDVLMTAAHCVYDQPTNSWGRNFTVYLGYSNGTAKATYDWQCTAVYTGWPQGDFGRDYAFIKLRGKAPKALGIKLGFTDNQWTSVGYPTKFDNAQKLKKVDGTRGPSEGNDIQMAHNPMSHGASGGAWIVGNYAVGVNSYVHTDDESNMYGPVFDGNVTRLYQFVRNGCTEDIIPIGQNPRIARYDRSKTYLEADFKTVAAGPTLVLAKNSDKCPCKDAEEIRIKNEASDAFEVDLSYLATINNPPEVQGSNRLRTSIPPKSTQTLGCTYGDQKGNVCPLNLTFSVQQIRRKIQIKDQKSTLIDRTVSPEFCADQCLNHPNGGYCLNLGGAAKSILVPLAGFVTDTINNQPTNGIVATKRDLIIRFKGDPDKQEDPCNRSDFYRTNEAISNDGIGCRTTSPVITGLPDEPRLSLRSPPAAQATRVANISSSVSNQALFEVRDNAPVLEFYGTNSDQINKLYGGHVTSVQRINGKLIVTTEFGCVSGDDK